MTTPVMELRNVSKIYCLDGVEVRALDGVSLKINKGEFISVVGRSGSGKSTLLNILGLLDRPTSGSLSVEGEETAGFSDDQLSYLRNKKIGFVFQSFNLLSRTPAIDNVELPLIYSGVPSRERCRRAEEALISVGLEHRLDHFPNQLSSGEKQRVAIARALVNNPAVILADEPTGNLDTRSGGEILDILIKLHKQKNTIILVTHDLQIAKMAQKTITLKDGKVEK